MLNIIADVLLPPSSLALLALFLLLSGARRARHAATAVLALLVALSLPIVSTTLLNSLAVTAPADEPRPGAIVILSGDGIRLEGETDLEPGLLTFDRLRAAAALYRRTSLPILVTGGRFLNARTSLAAMMGKSLEDDFRVPVRWQENNAGDTWQNAEYSAAILRPAGITRVYVVTHFWHMRRAIRAFRRFGLDPVPASVRPPVRPPLDWRQFVPSTPAWLNSYYAMHEWVGSAYYAWRR